MYGIFRESLVMMQNYFGRVTWFALYAAAFVFLFVREKDRMKRCLLLYAPLVTIVLFLFPLTLAFIDLRYSAAVVCMVATAAAIHEGYLINRKMMT